MVQHSHDVIKEAAAALERDIGVNMHNSRIRMFFRDGQLVLDGLVDNIAAKRLAPRLVQGLPDVQGVDDRLRVQPADYRADGAIRDSLINALTSEPALRDCTLRVWSKGEMEVIRDTLGELPIFIEARVEDSVIYLSGYIYSLSHKRLVEALAWWVPGSTNVVNLLEIDPPEEDSDDEIADALRLVLEKDPLVHADQIRITSRNRVVTLEGLVREAEEKRMAEYDAWYMSGVDGVVNAIEVSR